MLFLCISYKQKRILNNNYITNIEHYQSHKKNWVDPKIIAKKIEESQKTYIVMFSTIINAENRFSYIAYNLEQEIFCKDFSEINNIDNDTWFGYIGFETKEKTSANHYKIKTHNTWLAKYKNIIKFDHINKEIIVFYKEDFDNNLFSTTTENLNYSIKPVVTNIESNMTKKTYIENILKIKQLIADGVIYQANLTRKFSGLITNKKISYLDLFLKLCSLSPSSYSCYIKNEDLHIVSSSPELFIKIDNKRNAIAKPIKGTINRVNDGKDYEQIKKLLNSAKDISENLMITDLMRNDFAINSIAGTVKVPELFKITSYKTLHHMHSKIISQIKPEVNNIQFISDCFPPGSMTGTPKLKAIEICKTLEKNTRGIYSGAIGKISKNNVLDLSVIIRTLIIKKNVFEFQVGGAIIYDSDPIAEWKETLLKARAIAALLDIKIKTLEDI